MADFSADDYFNERLAKFTKENNPLTVDGASISEYKTAELTKNENAKTATLEFAGERSREQLKNSWVGQWGLDPNSAEGIAANLGVTALKGAIEIPKTIATGIHAAHAGIINATIPQEAKDAYGRKLLGKNTVEDDRILNESSLARGVQGGTHLEAIKQVQDAQGRAKAVREVVGQDMGMDTAVHTGRQDRMAADIRTGFDDSFPTLYKGVEQIQDGEVFAGAGQVVSGLAGMLATIGVSAVSNPIAATEMITQNVPQLVLAATGGGAGMALTNGAYALDAFSQGMEEYLKKSKGVPPSTEEMTIMAGKAASLAIAETVGDKLVLGGKLVTDTAKKLTGAGIKDAVADVATKEGFKAALKGAPKALTDNVFTRTAIAAVEGAAGEFGTEAFQTAMEEEIKGNVASVEDVFVGGALGAISGAGLSTGVHTLKELTGTTEEQLARKEAKALVRQKSAEAAGAAITTGDTSAWDNPKEASYAPEKAVAALSGNSSLQTTAPEAKAANFEKAGKIVADLNDQIEALQVSVDNTSPEALKQKRADAATLMASSDPESVEMGQEMLAEADASTAELPKRNRAEILANRSKLEKLKAQHAAATEAMNRFNVKQNAAGVDLDAEVAVVNDTAATPEAKTASVDRVINLSMAAPERLTDEVATSLASNESTSPKQKTYLEAFVATRTAATTANATAAAMSKTMAEVTKDILEGGGKNVGLAQYRERVAQAITSNSREGADKQLDDLAKFAHHISSKAEAMTKAYAKGHGTFVQRVGNGWAVATKPLTAAEIKATGAFPVKSENFIETVATQADALNAGLTELEAAYDLKFNATAKTVSQHTAPATPAKKAAAAPTPKESNEPIAPKAHAGTSSTASAAEPKVQAEPAPAVASGSKDSDLPAAGEPAPLQPQGVVEPSATVDAKSKTEAKPQSQDESVEGAIATEETGGLAVLATPTPLPEGTVLGKVFTTINRASTWLTQKKVVVTKDSDINKVKPLVAIANLMARWKQGDFTPQDFFPDLTLTDLQKSALRKFTQAHSTWAPMIQANFIKGSLDKAKFTYKDPLQDFVDADGNVEANVVTAIAYAAFSWYTDMANNPVMDPDQILDLHGLRPEEGTVTSEGMRQLRTITSYEATAHDGLGQRIMDALGLQVSDKSTAEYGPNLRASWGVHALQLLTSELKDGQRLVSLVRYQADELEELITGFVDTGPKFIDKKTKEERSSTTFKYVEIVKDENLKLGSTGQSMKSAVVGTDGILDKFFGNEAPASEAQLKPQRFKQLFAKGTKQKVSPMQAGILDEAQQVPNTPIAAQLAAFKLLGRDIVLQAAGFVRYHEDRIQYENRAAVMAQNDNLEAQLDGAMDLINAHPPGTPFFAVFDVWRNFRVGVLTRNMNLQTSKIHRYMFARPDWNSTIDLKDPAKEESYLVSVAQAFGIKVDAQPNAQTVGILRDMFQADPRIVQAARAIKEGVVNDQIKRFVGNFTADAEGMQTLQALVSLGDYLDAKAKGIPLETTMAVGADGKTNGPILSHLALGAADSEEDMLALMNRGGMYAVGDVKNFNHWKQKDGSKDLYEDLASAILATIKKNGPGMAAIEVILKPLLKGTAVTSSGRNLVKTPLTSFAFGSSVKKSIANMEQAFIKEVFNRIEGMVNGKTGNLTRIELVNAINEMLSMGGARSTDLLKQNITIEQMIELKFSKAQKKALGTAFTNTMGVPVKKVMNSYFKVFMERRDSVNKATGGAFGIYAAIYQDLRDEELNRLMDSGEVGSYMQAVEGGAPVRMPQHDLTTEQEKAITERVAALLPLANTAYSEGDLASGLKMVKSKIKQMKSALYTSEVQLGKRFYDGKGMRSKVATSSMDVVEDAPGVAGLSYFMHSLDSFIMHTSLRGSDTLNVHDEATSGVHNIEAIAQKINAATWKGMLEFSPPKEAFDMLHRAIVNAVSLANSGDVSAKALDGIEAALEGMLPKYPTEAEQAEYNQYGLVAFVLKRTKEQQFYADTLRLKTMSQFGSIDQYTWENGQYEVTDADRKDASDRYDALIEEGLQLPQDLVKASVELAKMLNESGAPKAWVLKRREHDAKPKVTPQFVETNPEDDSDDLGAPVKAEDLGTVPVTAPLVIEAVANRIDTPEAQQVSLEVQAGKPIAEAINDMPSRPAKAAVIQAVTRLASEQPKTSPFGKLGTSSIPSNPHLVAFFEANPNPSVKEVLGFLGDMFSAKAQSNPKNKDYIAGMWELTKLVRVTVNPDLKIKYIDPSTSVDEVIGLPATASRGWYMVKPGAGAALYVLSPEFSNSGLDVELMLHELTHAALAQVIAEHHGKDTEAGKLIAELENLRQKAFAYAKKNGLLEPVKEGSEVKDFRAALPAVKEGEPTVDALQEFVAWGMTNRAFQEQVLMQMRGMTSKTKDSPLRNEHGMKRFITTLVNMLMWNSPKSDRAKENDALANLIGNVSGLFAHAALEKKAAEKAVVLSMATPSNNDYTTETLFERLGKNGATVPSTQFQAHLSGVLSSIVDKLHGPFGSFHESLMQNQPLSPLDLILKAIQTGAAPFAAVLQASPLPATDQEQFVMDQVYTAVRAALESGAATRQDIYGELSKLYTEAKSKIKPADLNGGVWSVQAQAQYDFIFNAAVTDASGKSDYLARFAAFGLGHQVVNTLLKTETDVRKATAGKTFADKLQDLFQKVLGLLSSKITKSKAGVDMDENLRSVLDQLISVEVRYRVSQAKKANADPTPMDRLEKGTKKVAEAARKKAEKIGDWAAKKNNPYLSAVGATVSTVAGHRVEFFLKATRNLRDQAFKERDGILASILSELQGLPRVMQALVQAAKQNEQRRKQLMTAASVAALAAFDEKTFDLPKSQLLARKTAVTNVFMRTGAHHLTGTYSLSELENLLSDPKALQTAIASFESQLAGFGPAQHYYMYQATALATYLATGETPGALTLFNAHNIAQLAGTEQQDTLTPAQKDKAQAILEKLITLYAIQKQDAATLEHAHAVLKAENVRGAENGVEFLLAAHKHLENDARERIFSDEQVHMMHGYTPEIYNPNVNVVSAGAAEGKDLINKGYVRVGPISRDVDDPDQDSVALYVLKDGGLPHLLTGALSYTGENAKGATKHSGYMNTRTLDGQINAQIQYDIDTARVSKIRDMFKPNSKDNLANVTVSHMAPVLNPQGEVVNWRYLMKAATKDDILQRDNRFEVILGALAGQTFDKETSKDQNQRVLEALHADAEANGEKEADNFITIGPRVSDPAYKEIWNMLPDATKAAARGLWGADTIVVRMEMVNPVFGYHKFSAANVFKKADDQEAKNVIRKMMGHDELDELGWAESLFKGVIEVVLEASQYAQGKGGDEARDYARRAAYYVTRSERVMQEIVKETKDLIVIKTGLVMLGNIYSNHTLLTLNGVSQKDIVTNQLVALKAATAYQRDTTELDKIELMLNTGYTQGGSAELHQRAVELRDAIQRNPVKSLIDAGLMPTIVEDVAADDDLYSYKSALSRKVESVTKRINPTVKSVAKNIYMTHDTKIYQGLSRITQLSDFVARYTLYKHLTENKKLSHEEALKQSSDSFIVYDNPMHRSLQYLDDMGLTPFMKYFMRIQKVLLNLSRDNPARVLATLALGNFMNLGGTVLDGSWVHHLGNNPFHMGPLEFPRNLDELATVSSAMALLK